MATVFSGAAPARVFSRAMLQVGAQLGFHPPDAPAVRQARAVAERMMGCAIASEDTIARILALQPSAILTFEEGHEITGFAANLLLKAEAGPMLAAGGFDGLDPADALLARPGDPTTICYFWGIVGATKLAGAGVMELFRRLRFEALASLTAYALAATPVGRHVAMNRLGLVPVRSADDNILVGLPVVMRRAA